MFTIGLLIRLGNQEWIFGTAFGLNFFDKVPALDKMTYNIICRFANLSKRLEGSKFNRIYS
jgi:hypothetical protein